jgi:PadR family transcriptional regulator
MAKKSERQDLVQGTLEMLILKTLRLGPIHGHAIAKHIQRTSDEVLQVETGSLYPALRRLEEKGWISSEWEMSSRHNRELRIYRLTKLGVKQLSAQESKWNQLVRAIAGVMASDEV